MPAHARANVLARPKALALHRPPLDATGLGNWLHNASQITTGDFSARYDSGDGGNAPQHPQFSPQIRTGLNHPVDGTLCVVFVKTHSDTVCGRGLLGRF